MRHSLSRGLRGWWLFNEGSGSRVSDSSGNGNHGSLTNSTPETAWRGSPLGSSLLFDGTDDYVAVANHDSLNPTSALSISGWFKLTTAPNSFDGLIMKTTDGGWADGYGIFWVADASVGSVASLAFYVGEYTGVTGGLAFKAFDYNADLNWHHFAAVWDGATVSLYIDGIKGTDDTFAAPLTNSTTRLFLGADVGAPDIPGSGSPGALDDLRLYNRALTIDEIRQLIANPFANAVPSRFRALGVAITGVLNKQPSSNVYIAKPQHIGRLNRTSPLTRGLVGWWPFAEGGGPRIRDASGEQNTGTFTNPTLPTDWIGSIHGRGILLNGSSSYVTVPITARLQVETITVAMWLRFTALPVNPVILFSLLETGSSATNGYGIFSDRHGMLGFQFRTSGGFQSGGYDLLAIPMDHWVHFAVTYNGAISGDALYINGIQRPIGAITNVARSNQGGFITANTSALTFGARSGTSLFFNGAYDDVRIYNRALGAAEIYQLYSNPFAGFSSIGLVTNKAIVAGAVPVGGPTPGHAYQHMGNGMVIGYTRSWNG